MSQTQAFTYSDDRNRALMLARSGAYDGWRAICTKMLFDGWRIEVFNETAFTNELEAICSRERADAD